MTTEPEQKTSKLLLESEVAELLRCSTVKVKRLRLGGKLAYLPGRPVFILERDVEDYIQRERKIEAAKMPGSPEFQALQRQEIEKLARTKWLQHRLKRQRGRP